MKFNKSIALLPISVDVKKYVNNYINESIKLMTERGHIEEFIWGETVTEFDGDLMELIDSDIISYGYYKDGMLFPIEGDINSKFPFIHFMLSDKVLLENGFKTPVIKEETND